MSPGVAAKGNIVLYADTPDEVLILPWNIAEEVKAQLADLAEQGVRFTTAVPSLEIC